jgi:hypothetical protein
MKSTKQAARLHNQRAKRLVSARHVYRKQARQQAKKIENITDDYQKLHEDSHRVYVIQGRPDGARKAYFTKGFAGVDARAEKLLQGEAKLQARVDELSAKDANLRKSAGKILGVKVPKRSSMEVSPEVLAASDRRRSLRVIQADAQTHHEWWRK